MSQFIRPIEIDQTPNQFMYRLAEDMRQQKALERKLKMDDEARKVELLNSIDPAVLNKNFDRDVVNASINDLQRNIAAYLKQNPNGTSQDLQMYLQKQLGGVAQWSNAAQTIRKNIEGTVAAMKDNKGVDIAGLSAAAITRALRNPDGSLKTADQLDPNIDYAAQAYAEDPTKYIDVAKVGTDFSAKIKGAQKIKRNDTVQVVKDGKRVLDTVQFEINPWQDVVNGKVVTKKEGGYLVEDQFQALVPKGSVDDIYWTRMAKNRIAEHNANLAAGDKSAMQVGGVAIDDPANVELVKRALVTNYLDQVSGSSMSEIKKDTTPIKVTVNTGANKTASFIDGFKKLQGIVNTKGGYQVRTEGGKEVGALINKLPQDVAVTLLELANEISNVPNEDGQPRRYTQRDLVVKRLTDGSYQLIDVATKEELAPIDRQRFNQKYNETFGNKAELGAASDNQPTKPKTTSGISWK